MLLSPPEHTPAPLASTGRSEPQTPRTRPAAPGAAPQADGRWLLEPGGFRGSLQPLRYGLLAVLALFVATRLLVWTAAYAGAFVNFRIQNHLAPPFEIHEADLRAALTDPRHAERPSFVERFWIRAAGLQPRRDQIRETFQERLTNLAPLVNFDGKHYRSIVEGGYRYDATVTRASPPKDREQNIAFFPLYPLVSRCFAAQLGSNGAMILVSHAAALVAAVLFFLWARWRCGDHAALFGLAALLCVPSACYYAFAYAESLTLLLTVALCICIERRWWVAAAVCCGLATASRPTAAGLAGVLFIAYWFGVRGAPLPKLVRAAPLMLIAGAGLAAYAAFLTIEYGSPLVYFQNFRIGWVPDSQRADWFQYLTGARMWDQFKHFGRAVRQFPIGLIELINPFAWNMAICLFVLFLSVWFWRRVPRDFRPLLLIGPFIFLQSYLASGGATFGVQPMSRYMAVAAPAFVVLGAWGAQSWRPAVRHSLLALMLLIQGAWAFRFGLDEWSS